MPVLGEIAATARQYMPATWTALSTRQDFGEDGLQRTVDAAKEELFGVVTDYDDELTTYGRLGVRYAAVIVALRLISPGYDHWMTAATGWGAAGQRTENKTFIDRANALLKFRDEVLVPEEQRLYPQVQTILIGVLTPQRASIMRARDADDTLHVTPSPTLFPDPYERPAT